MSVATVITAGYGTFGSPSLIIVDGYDSFSPLVGYRSMLAFWASGAGVSGAVPPVPPSVAEPERFAGGYEYYRRLRKREPEDVRQERERWGILPKTMGVISDIAIRQAAAAKYDEQRYFEELNRELELQGIEWQGKYLEVLNAQRVMLIDAEIARLIKIQLDNEDMETIIALVAASI